MFRLATRILPRAAVYTPKLARQLITLSVETRIVPMKPVDPEKKQLWFTVQATGETEHEKNIILQILNQVQQSLQNSGIAATMIIPKDKPQAPILAIDNASIQAIIEYAIWKAAHEIYKKRVTLPASPDSSSLSLNTPKK